MTMTREEIENTEETRLLKRTLKMYRNHLLDYLIDHQPDKHVTTVLNAGDTFIKEWSEQFADYLATDNEYYQQVAHKMLEPVYALLDSREGLYSELEDERDALLYERNQLAKELQQLKKEIRDYYGG